MGSNTGDSDDIIDGMAVDEGEVGNGRDYYKNDPL